MSHQHPHGGPVVAEKHPVTPGQDCVEVGAGVCLRPSYHWRPDQGETQADRRIAGYVIAHETPGWDHRCEAALMTELGFGPTQIWTAAGSLAAGDLTLSPSVVCHTHKEFHAHVQNGRWTA